MSDAITETAKWAREGLAKKEAEAKAQATASVEPVLRIYTTGSPRTFELVAGETIYLNTPITLP